MVGLELIGVHGSGGEVYRNRLKKGVEKQKSNSGSYIALLGYHAGDGLEYLRGGFHTSDENVLIEGRARSTYQELMNLKDIADSHGYRRIGLVSQKDHLERIGMLAEEIFPKDRYHVELIEADEARSEEELARDANRERISRGLDRVRLAFGRLGATDLVEDLVELAEDFYSAYSRKKT